MKTKFLLLTTLTSIIFFACDKEEYHFTEAQKRQLLYYTYEKSDTIKFLKNGIDTVYIKVSDIYFQKSYKSYFGKIFPDNFRITFIDSSKNYFGYILATSFPDENICDYNSCIHFSEIEGVRNLTDKKIDELKINNINYHSVFEYKSQTSSSKIYANEKYGIIKAENDSTTYTLIP